MSSVISPSPSAIPATFAQPSSCPKVAADDAIHSFTCSELLTSILEMIIFAELLPMLY